MGQEARQSGRRIHSDYPFVAWKVHFLTLGPLIKPLLRLEDCFSFSISLIPHSFPVIFGRHVSKSIMHLLEFYYDFTMTREGMGCKSHLSKLPTGSFLFGNHFSQSV
jgi:hypothetical protein